MFKIGMCIYCTTVTITLFRHFKLLPLSIHFGKF